ncbi:hypothetical protein JHN63_02120 [Streptomyces sp. MBT65]|uniref:hypothetical protein n=1 Tax=Streptomyces sp. MBT65 TaxID=1488395 RepID=UPI001909AAAE|nr:hypothetical protein [Streptomyces sp. MBT65]MBK3572638.1 hypothetical protein [Streptomyces sp. MBT65]
MNQDPRHVTHELHSALQMAAGLLDLPLAAPQLEAMALELTGPVRALIAEALAAVGDDAPVRYAVTDGAFEESEFAGCVRRVGLDVDLDSPAVVLAERMRSTQHDVVSTEIPDKTTLGITVRPQSLDCWRWWMVSLGVDPERVTTDGTTAVGTGSSKGVTVNLRGEGVPELLTDRAAARLMGVITEPVAP